MRKVLAAAAIIGMAAPASAGVITLAGIAQNGANDFTFTYRGTLGPDEGLRSGDRLIIYDFEYTSPTGIVTPGFDDDPNVPNLVFTYLGPDFRDSGGPFPPFDFNGLSARSRFGGMNVDAFFGLSTKNNPDGAPGGSHTAVYTLGQVTVPAPAVPEPATWAMMIGGFGLAGSFIRRRQRAPLTVA